MIFIMPIKTWKEYKKKLVSAKDYIIFDGTEDDDAYMSRFTNTVTMDGFNPPRKIVKAAEQRFDDDIIDYDKIEELENKFFKGLTFKNSVVATVAGIIENGDINIFIVLKNKVYKMYKKKYTKAFNKMFPASFDFVYLVDDFSDIKPYLKDNLSRDELSELRNLLKKQEKELEKLSAKKRPRRHK